MYDILVLITTQGPAFSACFGSGNAGEYIFLAICLTIRPSVLSSGFTNEHMLNPLYVQMVFLRFLYHKCNG